MRMSVTAQATPLVLCLVVPGLHGELGMRERVPRRLPVVFMTAKIHGDD